MQIFKPWLASLRALASPKPLEPPNMTAHSPEENFLEDILSHSSFFKSQEHSIIFQSKEFQG
jgi:hypothetical protein